MTRNWTYNEGKALISACRNRKEEYFKPRNKKHFWGNILYLGSLNVLVSPTTLKKVEIKFESLHRAYKNDKDRGTGTTTTKFLYNAEMDEIFHDNPDRCSPHSVSVGLEQQPDPASMKNLTQPEEKKDKVKGKLDTKTLADVKRLYYEEKLKKRKQNGNYCKNILNRRKNMEKRSTKYF